MVVSSSSVNIPHVLFVFCICVLLGAYQGKMHVVRGYK
jgi:hypothetical protein